MCGGILGGSPPRVKQPREVQSPRQPRESARAGARRKVESRFLPPTTQGPSASISKGSTAGGGLQFRGKTLLG